MKRVLVTRPEPDNLDTCARLEALNLFTVAEPLMVRQNLDTGLPNPNGFGAMVLTSANALRALKERGELQKYIDLPVFSVGEKTAQAAKNAGFRNIQTANGDAASLIDLLKQQEFKNSLFYPSAKTISVDIAAALAPSGVLVITSPVYKMSAVNTLSDETVQNLQAGNINAIMFYSRRTAQIFCDVMTAKLSNDRRAALTMMCLSENVAMPLLGAKFPRIALSDYPSEEGMMALALSFARGQIL